MAMVLLRERRRPKAGIVEPCLPSLAKTPPSGPEWIHEIKHDGFRIMARRDSVGVRLITRNGHDFSNRFPFIALAVGHLPARSCLIDGEAIVTDDMARDLGQWASEDDAISLWYAISSSRTTPTFRVAVSPMHTTPTSRNQDLMAI